MGIRTYHDFVLFTHDVKRGAHECIESFNVSVFDSPVGQAEEPDPVNMKDQDKNWDYERLVDMSRGLEEREFDSDRASQIKLGTRLGDLLLPPHTRELFSKSYEWLNADEGLRLRLRLPPDLSDLPWEYVYLEDSGGNLPVTGFIALNPRISIVRHEALELRAVDLTGEAQRAEGTEWLSPAQPLDRRRVVIAMATPHPFKKYPALEALPGEQMGIREALGKVEGIEVSYLPEYRAPEEYRTTHGATLDDLKASLGRTTDIFHFSGHGEFEERLGPGGTSIQGEGWLVLADEHNQAKPASAEDIRELIGEKEVRLVVLGACESARRDSVHKLSSVAVSLLKGGIACVVAMQFNVKSYLAAAFSEAFYEALVAGLQIDEAVALGRAAMWARTQRDDDEERRDWGVPVLYLRTPGGRIFHPVTNEHAREQAEERSRARFDLNTAWWDWMAKGETATEAQLERLAAADDRLELSPVQALLLLRSAVGLSVTQDVSPTPWLERLRQVREPTLALLSAPGTTPPGPGAEARKVLRLDGAAGEGQREPLREMAALAVHGEKPVARQTAVLALTALAPDPQQGVEILEQAAGSAERWPRRRKKWPGRWWRRAELRGTLADAGPEMEGLNASLSACDRFGAWLWRVGRRLRRDGRRLGWLIGGGAIGAGLGLGVLRFTLSILPEIFSPQPVLPGVQLGMYAYWGAILGFFLSAGLLLADPLLLRPLQVEAAPAPAEQKRHLSRFLLSVGLGTLFGGLALLLEAWLNGLKLFQRPLVAPLGFLFGLGMSLALYGQPAAGWRQGFGRWILRLGSAIAGATLTQFLFILAGDKGLGIAISWPGSRYNAYFSSLLEHWWPGFAERVPRWADLVGLADAALVGVVLTVGMTWGMHIARRHFTSRDLETGSRESKGGEP